MHFQPKRLDEDDVDDVFEAEDDLEIEDNPNENPMDQRVKDVFKFTNVLFLIDVNTLIGFISDIARRGNTSR